MEAVEAGEWVRVFFAWALFAVVSSEGEVGEPGLGRFLEVGFADVVRSIVFEEMEVGLDGDDASSTGAERFLDGAAADFFADGSRIGRGAFWRMNPGISDWVEEGDSKVLIMERLVS